MRIAVSGTHFTGKSTLVKALLKELPNYVAVEEPYFALEELGYISSNPPSIEDFERQLECSIQSILESQSNTLFDRCPLDCLAYALALEESMDTDDWVEEMEDAIQLLDLIIFTPIESRDRIPVPPSEDLELRMDVHENLQEILFEDPFRLLENTKILEVTGPLEKRIKMVKSKLETDFQRSG